MPDFAALIDGAAAGDTDAMWALAKIHELGMYGLPVNIEQARHYYHEAFLAGEEYAEVYVKLLDEENKGDPEKIPLTWDNKRLIARRLQEYKPLNDAIGFSDEYVLQLMKDAGLPKILTDNIPEHRKHALFGVKIAWSRLAKHEVEDDDEGPLLDTEVENSE
jgi:TPR repeat protein